MTENTFHLTQMMSQSQSDEAVAGLKGKIVLSAPQNNNNNNTTNNGNQGDPSGDPEQPNPQIILHYQTFQEHGYEQESDDHENLIEQDEGEDGEAGMGEELGDGEEFLSQSAATTAGGTAGGGPPKFKQNNFPVPLQIPLHKDHAQRQTNQQLYNNLINKNHNNSNNNNNHQYSSFIGRLVSKDNILLISQNVIEIGRNSSKSSVDFHVGKNSFVSRKHLIVHYDGHDFNLICASKNGVFIDGTFQRKSNEPYKLPNS
jgi:hypothetical protein